MSQRFCSIVKHNSIIPNVLTKFVRVTNPIELWDTDVAWYFPSATHWVLLTCQICFFGFESGLGICRFRPISPCLIVEDFLQSCNEIFMILSIPTKPIILIKKFKIKGLSAFIVYWFFFIQNVLSRCKLVGFCNLIINFLNLVTRDACRKKPEKPWHLSFLK